MQITSGRIESAQKIVVYGPEGIGKTTFASQFPDPVFIDTEGSTKHIDVRRTPAPSSWTMIMEQVKYFIKNPHICKTLVIDTADWAEQLCLTEVCAKSQKASIEDFGYGKGYIYLAEEFGRLLNLLSDVIEVGINVVVTAHARMRKFEQPEELGAYDRWELKLQKQTAPLLKEWADMILFANYQIHVVNVDNQGAQKGKNKAQGGKRVMYTTHNPSWDAKNRHNLNVKLNFDYKEIEHCIVLKGATASHQATEEISMQKAPVQEPAISSEAQKPLQQELQPVKEPDPPKQETKQKLVNPSEEEKIPEALSDLMKLNNVTLDEIKKAVTFKGYYPEDTPFENYDPDFIKGVLVGAWRQVFGVIKEERMRSGQFVGADPDEIPFN